MGANEKYEAAMHGYTPSTESVRHGYIFGENHDCYYEGDVTITPDGLADGKHFDRWLKQVQAEAWDEGAQAGYYNGYIGDPINPYKEQS